MKLIADNEAQEGYTETIIGWLPKEWMISHLGDVSEIMFSNVDKKSYEDEIPVLLCNYTDVYYNDYITKKLRFMRATATQREVEIFSLLLGDVIITKDSETVDDIAVSTLVVEELSNVLCGYHLAIIRPNRNNLLGEYLTNLFKLNSIRHYFSKMANGVTRFGLNNSSINHVLVPLPPLPEQIKIAKILSTWDNAIDLTERLIATKERLRKALMQRLLTGKVRFPKFDSEWQELRLEDICLSLKGGGTPSTKIESYWQGKIPWITGADFGDLCISTIRRHISEEAITNSATNVASEGSLLVVSRTGVGKLAIAPTRIAYSQDITAIDLDETKADIYFILYSLELSIRHLVRYNQGTSINGVLRSDLKRHIINLGHVDEQKMIGAVLKGVVNEIILLQEGLEFLHKQKKGLMQQLLIGNIRVNVEED